MEHSSRGGSRDRGQGSRKRKRGSEKQNRDRGAEDDVLLTDIRDLLRRNKPEADTIETEASPTVVRTGKDENFPETEVTITELSSTGDGLALSPARDHVYAVPFTLPGDTPSPQRDDSLIKCQYFAKCGGCQFQMLPYEDQLKHKKRIIEKAYINFSGLNSVQVPGIEETMGSPLQYGYRTKLTPHFSLPGRVKKAAHNLTEPLNIGFMMKGRRKVMDIEDCPLGTDIVRVGLKNERQRVLDSLHQFKAGATLLVRENTRRIPRDKIEENATEKKDTTRTTSKKRAISRTKKESHPNTSTTHLFRNVAGTFFQNNNSILSPFTQYVRERALPASADSDPSKPKLKYLLDAYCGSGLFTIALSTVFRSSLGVDVAAGSIESARENARLNKLKNTGFAAADAAKLFQDVPYPPDQTLLVIDPPRKGCDTNFLKQLLAFGPARVVYVSCNVHTQARDVGVMVRGDTGDGSGKSSVRYEIESIKGFDFFPQTGHVESVAVLNRVANVE
ncbi:23S rRNA (uracil-5-)-methyltransferase rumA [Coccidioides immitis RMSCC 3703]|uniref:23S rRNA (Uracil-5-)-methyltransferase rumA n=1 Tax=Coccidioides immitis RMSCC 3703 TaxID=454286 RepID=A0A0J8TXP6_COCIT|nr:23S rRNA (uracil-5-)-methyltransferase rumA [Coccidioides immitis RMSCC 3703]